MAKIMIGIYNADEVPQLIYDLVKQGVSRHTIATVDQSGIDMLEGGLRRDVVEEIVEKHRSALSQGRTMVVAWVMSSWLKRAEAVMADYKPLVFEKERAR